MVHPQFDPVAFSIGPVDIHWYGIMYLIGFFFFWWLGTRRAARDSWRAMTKDDVEDLLFYGMIAVIAGGRLGYCLFYQPAFFLTHPLHIFFVTEGGMSAHGGILGCVLAMIFFAKSRKKSFFEVSDFVAPLVPTGLFFGRIGNFINGELWGRVCSPDFPLGMIFPQAGDNLLRHPSQLYECALEGAFLFVLLWLFSAKKRPTGHVSALFAIGYGIVRFAVEFVREPDGFLGLRAFGLTQGQWLTLPLIATGLWVIFFYRQKDSN
ncbi:MAG TPA: prolipoprotein diacylglyceryl transferase [Sutterella sp.]|nr:prolipoprotein diacylglyceryl transferase [Sutterella sp.]